MAVSVFLVPLLLRSDEPALVVDCFVTCLVSVLLTVSDLVTTLSGVAPPDLRETSLFFTCDDPVPGLAVTVLPDLRFRFTFVPWVCLSEADWETDLLPVLLPAGISDERLY